MWTTTRPSALAATGAEGHVYMIFRRGQRINMSLINIGYKFYSLPSEPVTYHPLPYLKLIHVIGIITHVPPHGLVQVDVHSDRSS